MVLPVSGPTKPVEGFLSVEGAAKLDEYLDKMDKDPRMVALKAVLDPYILKNAPPEFIAKFRAAKDKGEKIYLDGYVEILMEIHLRKDPELRKKLESGQISPYDAAQPMYQDVYKFTMALAKTSEEKQKAEAALKDFKQFLDEMMEKRPKPKTNGTPQNAGPQKQQVTS